MFCKWSPVRQRIMHTSRGISVSAFLCHFVPRDSSQCPMSTQCVGVQQGSKLGQGKHVMEATGFNGVDRIYTHQEVKWNTWVLYILFTVLVEQSTCISYIYELCDFKDSAYILNALILTFNTGITQCNDKPKNPYSWFKILICFA